jgi:hypothetical protein
VLSFAGHEVTVRGRCEGDVMFMVRPEQVRVEPPGSASPNGVPAELTDVADRGVYERLEFDIGIRIVAFTEPGSHQREFTPGDMYTIVFPPEALHILET